MSLIKNNLKTIIITAISTTVLIFALFIVVFDLNGERTINLLRFMSAKRFIETRYVNPVDDETIVNGAISGLVKSLNDPHSVYLEKKLYRQLHDQTSGSFGGIGVYMGFQNDIVKILSVMPDSPGEKVGLKANDEIIAVDSVPVADMNSEEVPMKIRGEIGTEVTLSIRRDGEDDKDYKITRDSIKIKTVVGRMLNEESEESKKIFTDSPIGYIRISNFSENSGDEFDAVFKSLKMKNMQGLILDLRENPGGVLTSCVDIARLLVPKGRIVTVIDKAGNEEIYDSYLEDKIIPMAVLIDGNSASASEILAGALKDTHSATLIGTKSFGKGSVQVVMPMFRDDGLKLTIAKYYTPSGVSIDGKGIEPDIEIQLPADFSEDTQLQKAIEVVNQKISGTSLETGESA